MTPAEEDALVKMAIPSGLYTDGNAIRLAIRAAYAQGREDAAKVCDGKAQEQEFRDVGYQVIAEQLAAAIRRGE